MSSVWNFCARYSDVVLRGLKWRPRETWAVFSGLLVSHWTETFFSVSLASPSFLIPDRLFLILRGITGFFQGGVHITLYVLTTEFVGPKHRSFAGTMVWIFYTSSLMLLSWLAYGIRDWRTLSIVISAPAFPLVIFWWWEKLKILNKHLNYWACYVDECLKLVLIMLLISLEFENPFYGAVNLSLFHICYPNVVTKPWE